MKKTAKKTKASQRKTVKDLQVKPGKGAAVRGGCDGSSKDPAYGRL